jgi:mannosyltransferase
MAQFPVMDIVPYMTRSSEVHPPLYFFFIHIWMFLGTKEWILRLSSVVFALLNLGLTVVLAGKIADDRAAKWSLLLLACSSFHITYSQELRMYPLLTFFFLLSFLIFFSWLERRSRSLLVLLCVINIIALYTHYFAFFIIAIESLYFFLNSGKYRSLIASNLIAQGLTAVLYTPWILHYMRNNRGQDLSLRSVPGLSSIFDLLSQIVWGPHLPPLFLPAGPSRISIYILAGAIAAALMIIAFRFLSKEQRMFPGLYLLFPLLTIALLSRYTKIRVFEYKYFIIITPVIFILLGTMLSRMKSRALPLILAALFLITNTFSWANYLWDDRYGPQNWKVASSILHYNCSKNDAILVHPSMMASCIYYYYHGNATIVPTDDCDRAELEERLRPFRQVWLCTTPFHPYVARVKLLQWFDSTYREVNYALFPAKTFVPSNVILMKAYEKKSP